MVLPKLVAYLEQNLDKMVHDTIAAACQRFERYRTAAEIELANIQQSIRSTIAVILQVLRGKKIDEEALDATLIALAERRARQGYPLSEVLGMFQLVKEITYRYLQDTLPANPDIGVQDLLEFDIVAGRLFHRLELGLVGPYLQFQDNIIQAQQSFLKHKFSSLFRLVEAISNNLNIQEFCEILLDYLCRFYDVKISAVFLLDEREKELYPQHVTGLSRRFKNEHRYSVSDEPFKRCLREGRAFSINNAPFHVDQLSVPLPEAEAEVDFAPKKERGEKQSVKSADYPLCSSLYAPMIGRQRTYGVVTLHSLKLRRFNQNEVQQFETLARIVAIALENARFYQNLIEEKGKLDAIVNSVSDGLILIDFHEEIVFVNDQAARYFQQPAYRLLGASASVLPERLLANAKDPHIIQAAYLRALTNIMDYPVLECTLYRPDVVDIRLTMFPVRDRDRHFIGRGLIIEDITHEKEVNRMKSEFVAIASHTMRTPITSILGFASLLIEKQMAEETQIKYIHSIYRESQRLTNILNDMLDLMNIEAGKISLHLMPVDVMELVKSIVQEARNNLQREIILVQGGRKRKLPRLIADRQKFGQALNKLLSNAVKYTSGKIKLTVKKVNSIRFRPGYYHSEIHLDIPGLFPAIAFSVEDSGEGIPYDQLNTIFEPFHRIRNERVRMNEGSGLGLTITRYIVEAHGGKIWVESKAGKGSIFTFILPLELTSTGKNFGLLAI